MTTQSKQSLLYIVIVTIVYVLIGIIEFFVGPYLLDVITDNQWIHLITFGVCLVLINPIITAIIAGKIPYKIEGLKKIEKPKSLRKRPIEVDNIARNKKIKHNDIRHRKIRKDLNRAPK